MEAEHGGGAWGRNGDTSGKQGMKLEWGRGYWTSHDEGEPQHGRSGQRFREGALHETDGLLFIEPPQVKLLTLGARPNFFRQARSLRGRHLI